MIGKNMKRILFISLIFFVAGCGNTTNGWTTLFDGKNIHGMRGYKMDDIPWTCWEIKDGELKTIPNQPTVDIITKEQYKDFELELEWKTSPAGNSGIFHNATEENDWIWHSAPEMQVLDDEAHQNGQNPKTSAGALYDLIAPINKTLKPVGEFNRVKIKVQNNEVEYWINGSKIVEFVLASPELAALIENSKFKTMPNFTKASQGHVGLQHHGEEVWYRNIRIRKL